MQNPIHINRHPSDYLDISFLGGLGEIGLNMMAVEYGGVILVIDAGLMFPEEHMLGIDFVIPDTSYLRDNKERIAAIILTHGHEDHIGALLFIAKDIQVPIYGARFTLELVRQKLKDCRQAFSVDLRQVSAGNSLNIGPFHIEFIRVCHSIVDCLGLAIRTPLGTLIHSGDFKIDLTPPNGLGTDMDRFAYYGQEGVLALLSDSTNAELEGHSLSEQAVRETLKEIFAGCKGRIIMGVFASNIQRIQQAVDLSVLYGRKVIFNGKSMVVSAQLAQELGYLNIPPEVEIDIRAIDRFPESKITLITTGSQAEPLSAITRTALGQHKQIVIRPHDTVIFSSRFIPGNERAITSVINLLYRQGAEVVYETVSDIHASGHAYREELKDMVRLTRPRYFIPIHGEYRQLVRHAKVAQEMGIPQERILMVENGHRIVFHQTGVEVSQNIPAGRVFVDGKGVGDVDKPVLRDRRHLSEDGMVLAVVVVDRKTGELLAAPDIISRGFIQEKERDNLLEYAKGVVLKVLEEVEIGPAVNWSEVSERIKRELKRFFNTAVERRPVILPVVVPM